MLSPVSSKTKKKISAVISKIYAGKDMKIEKPKKVIHGVIHLTKIFLVFLFLFSPLTAFANSYSLELNGSSQYADTVGVVLTNQLTFEFWVKPTSLPGDGETYFFLSKFITGNDNASYQARISNSGGSYTMHFAVVDNPFADEFDFPYDLSTGVWTHVAFTWLGSTKTAKMYINGTQTGGDQTGLRVSSINSSLASFQVGARNATLLYPGLIDELRVWTVVRTQSQIDTNKCVDLSGSTTNLQEYWKFENNLLDSSDTVNDLTGHGSPTFSTDVPCGGGSPTPTSTPLFYATGTAVTDWSSPTFDAFFSTYEGTIYWGAGSVLFLGLMFGILETLKSTWQTNQKNFGAPRNWRGYR